MVGGAGVAMTVPDRYIRPQQACTLAGLFRERLARTPHEVAYRYHHPARKAWCDASWQDMALEVGRWQLALQAEGLQPGDRVGIMARNSREWMVFDQAALGLGLVTVPLYTNDRADNVAYIARDSGIKLLVVDGRRQWRELRSASDGLPRVRRIVSIDALEEAKAAKDPRLVALREWISALEGPVQARDGGPDELATIVYTSGTTGAPKGVMLSHGNILHNAYAAAQCGEFTGDDVFLSFLPLSHTLERTAGYYLAMMVGARTAYTRSVLQLAQDLKTIRPTVLISVPRIYEMIHNRIHSALEGASPIKRRLFHLAVDIGWRRFEYRQGRGGWGPGLALWPALERAVARKVRDQLGGRVRFAICGGAALPPSVSRLFVALGVPVYQGYGMTESSPVISVNRPRDNVPASVGLPLPGVEVRVGERDELLTRSPSVMQGYWNNAKATREAIDESGWLHTGDQARIDPSGHVFITGRLKEIIVLANGEKVPPADMEMAILDNPLMEQVMVVGEARPYLSALVVLNEAHWKAQAQELGLDPRAEASLRDRAAHKTVLGRIGAQLSAFPGYAQIRRVTLMLEPWTIEDGLLTPTLKMRRPQILKRFETEIQSMYQGDKR
jgi:long-chain acyl-CoA synthetase